MGGKKDRKREMRVKDRMEERCEREGGGGKLEGREGWWKMREWEERERQR